MKESETIKQYSDRIMAIVNNIRLLGEDFNESRVVEKVITTLPEKFESKISSLEDSRELSTISLSKLVNSLYALEQRTANRLEERPKGALQAKTKESLSSSHKRKKPWLEQKEKTTRDAGKKKFPPCIHCKRSTHLEKYCWYRPDIQCRSCKQFGHVEKVCKNKGRAQTQQQNQAQAAEDVQAQEEHVFTAICLASLAKVRKNWLVDSGYTHHMASDEGCSKILIEASLPKSELEMATSLRPEAEEMYVGQLIEKGYSLVFKNNSCIIEDPLGQELVTQKSKVFEAFSKFKALVENQSGCKIKALRSNNGTEYLFEKFQKLCEQAGIHHQLTTIYTPQQNGVLYRLNKLPTNVVKEKTPFEAWHGLKPTVSHLKVFGCVCYTLIRTEKRTKLERRFVPRIFVGYSSTKKAYRVFDPSTKKIMVSRDVKLDEGIVFIKGVMLQYQQYGIDFIETFAPVARLDTIKLLFALAAQKGWRVHQLDVKSTFLNGFLKEEIFIDQSEGFKVPDEENKKILNKYCMSICKTVSTPVAQGEKLASNSSHERVDEKEYRSLVGCLLYLTATRPDIMYAISLLSRFIHCCDIVHFKAAKKVHRYVKRTLNFGVKFEKGKELKLTGYSIKQQTVAQSTTEAEYIATAAAVNQVIWLRKLLYDLNEEQVEATEIRVDNHSENQLADILTKSLGATRFDALRRMIGVCCIQSNEEC
ncbi:Integrase, catalytic core [Gossypium australe]|uniref:Integrase, catalytic core n=1 Tax=Gossypium australe TaxID=47621 RepID=A0A5B6WNN1_9ROSI|nr:Integrase, catalytic core [Gossypium australe]